MTLAITCVHFSFFLALPRAGPFRAWTVSRSSLSFLTLSVLAFFLLDPSALAFFLLDPSVLAFCFWTLPRSTSASRAYCTRLLPLGPSALAFCFWTLPRSPFCFWTFPRSPSASGLFHACLFPSGPCHTHLLLRDVSMLGLPFRAHLLLLGVSTLAFFLLDPATRAFASGPCPIDVHHLLFHFTLANSVGLTWGMS